MRAKCIGMKLAFCFILTLTSLMAAEGRALYATRPYTGQHPKIIRKQKAPNIRSGSVAPNPQGFGPARKCGACANRATRQQNTHQPGPKL